MTRDHRTLIKILTVDHLNISSKHYLKGKHSFLADQALDWLWLIHFFQIRDLLGCQFQS